MDLTGWARAAAGAPAKLTQPAGSASQIRLYIAAERLG